MAIKAVPAILSMMVLSSCATDPAVRLAHCVEGATKELRSSAVQSVKRTCNLSQEGKYIVVLYPNILLSDTDLANSGMNTNTIATVRSLRFPHKPEIEPFESMYVIPQNKQYLPSRTTYYRNFASIPKLMFLEKDVPQVKFTIIKAFGDIELADIR